MIFKRCILSVIAFVLALSSGFSKTTLFDKTFIKAKAFESVNQYDSAFCYYRQAIIQDPSKVELYLNRAKLYLKWVQYDSAIVDYNQANKLIIGSGYFGLSRCYAAKGMKNEMFKALQLHLESSYRELPGTVRLDKYLSRYNKTPEWIEFWKKEWYNKTDIMISEARYMLENKDYVNLVLYLSDKENPKLNHELIYIKAEALYGQENYKSALSCINEAIESTRKEADYFFLRAQIYNKLSRYKEASDDCSEAIARKPWAFEWYIIRCKTLQKAEDYKEVIIQADEYLTYFPGNEQALFEKGYALIMNGQTLKALECLNKCIQASPTNTTYLYARSKAYNKAGMYKNAFSDLQTAININPVCDTLWMEKAMLHFRLGQKEEACKNWLQAEKLHNPKATLLILENCKSKK